MPVNWQDYEAAPTDWSEWETAPEEKQPDEVSALPVHGVAPFPTITKPDEATARELEKVFPVKPFRDPLSGTTVAAHTQEEATEQFDKMQLPGRAPTMEMLNTPLTELPGVTKPVSDWAKGLLEIGKSQYAPMPVRILSGAGKGLLETGEQFTSPVGAAMVLGTVPEALHGVVSAAFAVMGAKGIMDESNPLMQAIRAKDWGNVAELATKIGASGAQVLGGAAGIHEATKSPLELPPPMTPAQINRAAIENLRTRDRALVPERPLTIPGTENLPMTKQALEELPVPPPAASVLPVGAPAPAATPLERIASERQQLDARAKAFGANDAEDFNTRNVVNADTLPPEQRKLLEDYAAHNDKVRALKWNDAAKLNDRAFGKWQKPLLVERANSPQDITDLAKLHLALDARGEAGNAANVLERLKNSQRRTDLTVEDFKDDEEPLTQKEVDERNENNKDHNELIDSALSEIEQQKKGAPSASSIEQAAEIHGDLRTPSGESPGEVSAEESGRRIQPPAESPKSEIPVATTPKPTVGLVTESWEQQKKSGQQRATVFYLPDNEIAQLAEQAGIPVPERLDLTHVRQQFANRLQELVNSGRVTLDKTETPAVPGKREFSMLNGAFHVEIMPPTEVGGRPQQYFKVNGENVIGFREFEEKYPQFYDEMLKRFPDLKAQAAAEAEAAAKPPTEAAPAPKNFVGNLDKGDTFGEADVLANVPVRREARKIADEQGGYVKGYLKGKHERGWLVLKPKEGTTAPAPEAETTSALPESPPFQATGPKEGTAEFTKLEAEFERATKAHSEAVEEFNRLRSQANATKYGTKKKADLEAKAAKARDKADALREPAEKVRHEYRVAWLENTIADPATPPEAKLALREELDKENKAKKPFDSYTPIRDEATRRLKEAGATDEEATQMGMEVASTLTGYPGTERHWFKDAIPDAMARIEGQRRQQKVQARLDELEEETGMQSSRLQSRARGVVTERDATEALAEIEKEYKAEKKRQADNEAKAKADKEKYERERENRARELASKGSLVWRRITRGGESVWDPVEGKPIKIPGWEEYQFSIFKHDDMWNIVENRTGLRVGGSSNRQKAFDNARENLTKAGKEKMAEAVAKSEQEAGPKPGQEAATAPAPTPAAPPVEAKPVETPAPAQVATGKPTVIDTRPAVQQMAAQVNRASALRGSARAKALKNELVRRLTEEATKLADEQKAVVEEITDEHAAKGDRRFRVTVGGGVVTGIDVQPTPDGKYKVSWVNSLAGGGSGSEIGKDLNELLERQRLRAATGSGKVTISIPGDGDFTVFRHGPTLMDLADKADAISTSPNRQIKVSGGTGALSAYGRNIQQNSQAQMVANLYGGAEKAYQVVKRQIERSEDADVAARGQKLLDALYELTPAKKINQTLEAIGEQLNKENTRLEKIQERLDKAKKAKKPDNTRIAMLENEAKDQQGIVNEVQEMQKKKQGELDAMHERLGIEAVPKMEPVPEEGTIDPNAPGMGFATAAEYAASPQTPTSIKNAVVDRERAARGLPSVVQPARRGFGRVWDEAMAKIDQDPTWLDSVYDSKGKLVKEGLIDELRRNPRALTDLEDAALLHRQIDLQNEYGKLTRQMAENHEAGNAEAVEELKLRVANMSDQLLDIYEIGKRTGTETGRGLNARKMMAYEDFSLAQMESTMRAAKGGAPLTESETVEITKLQERIAELEKQVSERQEGQQQRGSEQASQQAHPEIVREAQAEETAESAPERPARPRSGGTEGEGAATRRGRTPEQARDSAIKRLGEAAEDEETTDEDLGRIIQQLARAFVRMGIDERVPLVNAVHEVVKDILPEMEWRDTMDAISGYGKFTPLKKDDVSVRLRDLKGQMQQASKFLDMMQGKAPSKTGLERRTPSRLESEMQKMVNKAKKWFNIKTAGADRLKTALQTVKTRLRNQIADLEEQIASRVKKPNERVPGPTDAESKALTARRDELKAQFDQIFGKPELTDEQRVQRAIASVERQAAEIERQIREGDIFFAKRESRTPTTPELQAAQAKRDALKAQREYLRESIQPTQKLTPEERAVKGYQARLAKQIEDLQTRLAKADYSKKPRRPVPIDEATQRLRAQRDRLKEEFDKRVLQERLKQRTPLEKMQDALVKWSRAYLLSGPQTLAKLTAAAVLRLVITPGEELVGAGLSKLFPTLAERAPREGGFNTKAEARALTEGLTKGMKDAWQTLRTGKSDLDVLYGRRSDLPPEMTDFLGHIHGALKAPVKRAEFARALEKRTEHALRHGVDVSDPMVQTSLAVSAYKDANRSIFLQDNRVVNAYKAGLAVLGKVDKTTGRVPLGAKAATTAIKGLLPIVKVPTNIVAETLQYATGAVTGSGRLAMALRRGVETLQPDEADLIMRELKKGSLGTAVMLVGYFAPQIAGGFYQPGQKKPQADVPYGNVRVGGVDFSHNWVHAPLAEALQIGATVRRVADSRLRKHDATTQGLSAGILAAALGLLDEVPFIREMALPGKLSNAQERGAYVAELAKSRLVPQAVSFIAEQMDRDVQGNLIKRHPTSALQGVESGIPGLRTNVPVRMPRRP